MKKWKIAILLVLILLLGLVLRLGLIFNSGSLWFDDAISLSVAQKDIFDSWRYLQWENNPPAHYWFLHFWIKVFGQSETTFRFSSLLFSILIIPLFYLVGHTLTRRPGVGLLAAFLSAISSYYLYIGSDVRMYPMLLFFFLLSIYFLWRYLDSGGKSLLIVYIFFSLITLYTHLIGLSLVIVSNIYWAYHHFYLRKKESAWRSWFLGQALIILLFLPWLLNFISHNISRLSSSAWYFNTGGSGNLLLELPRSYFFLILEQPLLEILALLVFCFLVASVFVSRFEWLAPSKEIKIKLTLPPPALFAFLLFLVPMTVGFCLQIWVSKYYVLGSPGIFLLLAMGFEKLKIRPRYQWLAIVGFLLLLLPYSLMIVKTQGQNSWDKIANYVTEVGTPGDVIFFPAFVYNIPFSHYYHGSLPTSNSLTEKLGDDQLLLAVKYNWYPVLTPEDIAQIPDLFKGHKRVIVVYVGVSAQIHHADLVLDKLITSNWPKVSEKSFDGFFDRSVVYIFKNPSL